MDGDGTRWHPLAMTGASLDLLADLDITKGKTILSYRSVNSKAGTPDDEVDARV